jgi:hypothetical protein
MKASEKRNLALLSIATANWLKNKRDLFKLYLLNHDNFFRYKETIIKIDDKDLNFEYFLDWLNKEL